MRSSAILLAVALSCSGCVLKSQYLDLETQSAATRAELEAQIEALQGRIAALEGELASASATIVDRDAELAQLREDLDAERARVGQLERDKAGLVADKSKLGAAIGEMEQALHELERRKRAADARVAEFKDMLARFKKLIDAGTLKVKMVDGRMVVELATDILFDSGSAALSAGGSSAVAEVAAVLESIPERRYQVEGHTDDVPMKSQKYASNWELASGRALTVVKAMIDAGLSPGRVAAASYGEFRPAADNASPEGRMANRRIEIVVVPDLSTLPGFDELKSAL